MAYYHIWQEGPRGGGGGGVGGAREWGEGIDANMLLHDVYACKPWQHTHSCSKSQHTISNLSTEN